MLRPFAHPVVCCCVLFGDAAQSLKPIKRLFSCKRTQQLPTLVRQQCWEFLRPFARSLTEVKLHLRCRLGSVDGALLGKRSFGFICTFAAICLYIFLHQIF